MEEITATKLDQIREILVGDTARESDRRYSALQDRIAKETAELRSEIRELSQALNERCDELAAIHEKLRAEAVEKQELSELLTNVARRLSDSAE